MKKKPYRTTGVKALDVERLCESVRDRSMVVGIDVGKETMVGAVMETPYEALVRIRWSHPEETEEFLSVMSGLPARNIQFAMEPSGTYGDSVRYQLMERGWMVFRVSPKRAHDAREVYDGVPSLHDGKSSMLIGKLHMDGLSEPWGFRSTVERELGAAIGLMEMREASYQRYLSRLEAQMARHWPELGGELDLGSATALGMLKVYGGPGGVRGHEGEASKLMRCVGGSFLKASRIEGVLRSARETLGVPQIEEEAALVRELAEEADRWRRGVLAARRRVEELSESDPETHAIGKVVGKATASVLKYCLGSANGHLGAGSYVKSAGLNLKEKSSGKYVGQLKITKRGPGLVRRYLWMAVLRLIQKDGVFKAWYDRKVCRDGGKKGRAIVALMRKLLKGLWHVGCGAVFDCRLLFDTRRLGLASGIVLGE
jgi:hypothetical protein